MNVFPDLETLDLGNNFFQGSIPDRIGSNGMALMTGPGVQCRSQADSDQPCPCSASHA